MAAELSLCVQGAGALLGALALGDLLKELQADAARGALEEPLP